MSKRTFAIKWLVFAVFYVVGGLCCVGFGIAWYQNEKNLRVSELIKRVELSLKPITMVAEVGISARNYYILDNEDFIRLFHLEQGLRFFRIEGTSDAGEQFEFSYCPSKNIGSYSKYPKLYLIQPGDSPERKAKKEKLNRRTMQEVEDYQKQITEFRRPPELDQKKMFYDSQTNDLHVLVKINNKNGGKLWAVFDASDIAKVKRDVFRKVLIIGLIAILTLILPAMIIAQLVAKPLGRLVKQLTRQLENLDLAKPLAVGTFVTEIKQVVTSMNWLLTQKLNKAIAHAQKVAFIVGSGASQQASEVEETTSSLEEMASVTRQNADNAEEANKLMSEAFRVVDQANRSVQELTQAMNEISAASDETAKINKTVDEIAFQTNLLALNAAVEAARAGEAGAGFAVVADEVRNLAMRAAESAKNTAELIEATTNKVKGGASIVTKTNEDFSKVTENAKKVGLLVQEITVASQDQAQGIEQVTKALAEIDKAIQENAGEAEELTAVMSIFTTDNEAHIRTQTPNG